MTNEFKVIHPNSIFKFYKKGDSITGKIVKIEGSFHPSTNRLIIQTEKSSRIVCDDYLKYPSLPNFLGKVIRITLIGDYYSENTGKSREFKVEVMVEEELKIDPPVQKNTNFKELKPYVSPPAFCFNKIGDSITGRLTHIRPAYEITNLGYYLVIKTKDDKFKLENSFLIEYYNLYDYVGKLIRITLLNDKLPKDQNPYVDYKVEIADEE